MLPFPLVGGLFLGWSVGANDAANVFGTAVASRIISFRKACVICSLAIIAGAVLQGEDCIRTYGQLTSQTTSVILIICVCAAVTATIMTLFRLPVSTSQAVVGAIVGVGLVNGNVEWPVLQKIIICWVATPIGALIISCIVYKLLGIFLTCVPMSILTRDKILWGGLLVVGTYGSYALGANNTANATGIFSGQFANLTDQHLAVIGGVAIAFGVLTFSRGVMLAVGAGIMPLDAFTAFTAVFSMSVTVHFFAMVGVPVSTSQGIVGAIIGIGLMRGIQTIRYKKLGKIATGWVMTPVVSLVLAAAAYGVFMGVKI